DGDTANPYLITAVSPTSGNSSTTYTLTISPNLANGLGAVGKLVQIFSPYMSYTDNPPRPKHHLWFGPMTWLDWLGNYNCNNWWWPGNVHEAQGWQCKVGIQTAISDIKNNHPSDLLSLVYFSSPKYSNAGAGQWNQAIVAMGRRYQDVQDS